jgi:hypothetical protein
MRVTVQYESEEVFLDMNKGQCFDDFRSWVFFRFQIPRSDQLLFRRHGGDDLEVIPSFAQLRALRPAERVVRVVNRAGAQKQKQQQKQPSSRWALRNWYPLLALLLLGVLLGDLLQLHMHMHPMQAGGGAGVDGKSCGGSGGAALRLLRRAVDRYRGLWASCAGVTLPDKVAMDAATTLLAYPVTTFFIRRLMNPDTGQK